MLKLATGSALLGTTGYYVGTNFPKAIIANKFIKSHQIKTAASRVFVYRYLYDPNIEETKKKEIRDEMIKRDYYDKTIILNQLKPKEDSFGLKVVKYTASVGVFFGVWVVLMETGLMWGAIPLLYYSPFVIIPLMTGINLPYRIDCSSLIDNKQKHMYDQMVKTYKDSIRREIEDDINFIEGRYDQVSDMVKYRDSINIK